MRKVFCLFILSIAAGPAADVHAFDPGAALSANGADVVRAKGGVGHFLDDVPASTFPEGSADSSDDVTARLSQLSLMDLDEVLWLARCVYSESDRANEQELVAWVVRNRVETQYRGRTYREVVLETMQFSAFNDPSRRRDHILSLDQNTPLRAWRGTLAIALDVYEADDSERPFAQSVRHFYSPVSMIGGRTPTWAQSGRALSSARLGIDRERFIFFDDVDEQIASADGFPQPLSPGTARRVSYDGGDKSGFSIQLQRPSGKVNRPRRPSVEPARSSRP